MEERRNTRQYLLVSVAVVALLVSAAGFVTLAQPGEGDVFTGCLDQKSGNLGRVAIGFEPANACKDKELQITWDRAGPAFEGRIAALEERVDQQTVGAPSPVRLFAAATVDIATIASSVGPIESVTNLGNAHYEVRFGEDVLGDIAPNLTGAFISLATNSSDEANCTYVVSAPDQLDIYCRNRDHQPEDAEWSLIVFSTNTVLPPP